MYGGGVLSKFYSLLYRVKVHQDSVLSTVLFLWSLIYFFDPRNMPVNDFPLYSYKPRAINTTLILNILGQELILYGLTTKDVDTYLQIMTPQQESSLNAKIPQH